MTVKGKKRIGERVAVGGVRHAACGMRALGKNRLGTSNKKEA